MMRYLRPLSVIAVTAALAIPNPSARAEDSAAGDPVAAPRPAAWIAHDLLSRIPEDRRTPESEAMVRAIASGQMGPNQGWYRPGESRFGWEWLQSRFDADEDGGITAEEFRGPAEFFARLDRDRNRRVQPDDFDWSNESPYMRQFGQAQQIFRRLDDSSDGRLDRDEWLGAFERLSGEDEMVTAEDLRELMFPPAGRGGERPSLDVLITGLASGEIGSHQPGPDVDDPAPEFELRMQNGQGTVRLSDFRHSQPVVLIFGSFT
jgi:hypothetical protein